MHHHLLFPKKLLVLSAVFFFSASLASSAAIAIDSLGNSGTDSTMNINTAKAANFIMPSGVDYVLDSIVINVASTSASSQPFVELWSDDGSAAPIGSLLETLSDPGSFGNGTNTFTSTGTTLTAGSTYWVVVGTTAGGGDDFDWLGSTNTTPSSTIGATHDARLFGDPSDGIGTWTSASGVLNAVQVNVTAVPEPSMFALLTMVLGATCFMRRRGRLS